LNFKDLKPGKSVEGDDIASYVSKQSSDTYTYLMAGVHGDEVEGVYVLKKLLDWLSDEEGIQTSLVVIPVLNVDGHRHATRVNAHGVDLNRNCPSKNWKAESTEAKYHPGPSALSEPESLYMDKLFKKFPPHLILTFHSWKPLLNYNGDCRKVADFLSRYNEYEVSDDVNYPTPGSLGEYAPEAYNCPVLTFECPVLSDTMTLEKIWLENETGLKALMHSELIHTKS
jgi:protein MpaA